MSQSHPSLPAAATEESSSLVAFVHHKLYDYHTLKIIISYLPQMRNILELMHEIREKHLGSGLVLDYNRQKKCQLDNRVYFVAGHYID